MSRLLHDWVREQADHRGDASAVVLQDERISYGELEAYSNRLARALRQQGCTRGERVCLLMPKSPLAIACLLGIYKADCIYVPLDPSSPVSRLAKIISSCEPGCVLAAGNTVTALKHLRQEPGRDRTLIGWMDASVDAAAELPLAFRAADVSGMPSGPVRAKNRPSDPAHILFTSGSTGTPKGVVITHANVLAFVDWAKRYFHLDESDRLSGHPPLPFDLSVFDIFGSFAAGAELHLVPAECNLLPQRLAEWIRASGITQWFSVPAALNYMAKFDVVRPCDFPELRRVLWCGEVLPTAVLLYWMRAAAARGLHQSLRADRSDHREQLPHRSPFPAGRDCAGPHRHRLRRGGTVGAGPGPGAHSTGRDRRPLPRGCGPETGLLAGPGVDHKSVLHARQEGAGAQRVYRTGDLARRGEDGLVYFVGREDTRIKSRGYRIELGEIETALNSVDELRECAVVAVPGESFEGYMVCCAYVPKDHDSVTPARLRSRLSRLLPEYMIPSQWRALNELPKNPAGKIDRRSLKETWTQHGTDTAQQ